MHLYILLVLFLFIHVLLLIQVGSRQTMFVVTRALSLLRTLLLSTAALARRAWRLGPVDAVKPLPFSSPLPTRLNPNLLFPPHFHLWLSPPLSFPPRAHTFMQFLRAYPPPSNAPPPKHTHPAFPKLVSANIAQKLFEHKEFTHIYNIMDNSDLLKKCWFLFFYFTYIFSLRIRSALKYKTLNIFAILHEISDILHANLLQWTPPAIDIHSATILLLCLFVEVVVVFPLLWLLH